MSSAPPGEFDKKGSRTEALFYEALDQPISNRDAFLIEKCGSDLSLREEVSGLLRDYDRAGTFLPEGEKFLSGLGIPANEHQRERPGDRIGPYKLLEQIGEGGFGVVWTADQEQPIRRRVALKIVKIGMDTRQVVARFEQERQALAMMDHPNIAKVLDAGATPSGRSFFVMELVRGIKITDYCDEAQHSTEERLRLFTQVCQAVQHAHQKGIIHRDIKPSNVLVTLHDGVPVTKVIDFGVAKATQQQRLSELTIYTAFQQLVGTPLYMAPEQAEMSGLDVDTRSDIYSLGVLLYELLTGRTPFDPERLMKVGYDEMRKMIREEEPQKPSTLLSTMALERRATVAKQRNAEGAKLVSSIKGDLDWIVMKALEKDRNRRYETATSLARDIERHLTSQPVLARPPSVFYRLRRFVRRNRVLVTAGSVTAVAMIIGAVGVTWQAVRAHRGEAAARSALDELRKSAPAFVEQARLLASKEKFDEALGKLDVAVTLRPDAARYFRAKAELLQTQLKFADAAKAYRRAAQLDPGDQQAIYHAALSERLAKEAVDGLSLSRDSLVELLAAMTKEQRSTVEIMPIGRLVGDEQALLLSYWTEKLRDLPMTADWPLNRRLTVCDCGKLRLDLNRTAIADLSPLKGMPLEYLSLSDCRNVTDLSPLVGLPLVTLHLQNGRRGIDLLPLASIPTLQTILLPRLPRNIEALRALPNLKYVSYEWDRRTNGPAQRAEDFWNNPLQDTAESHARAGNLTDAEKLLRNQVNGERHLFTWMALAAVLLHRGDNDGYASVTREMFAFFRNVKRGGAIGTAEVCLLSDTSPIENAEVASLLKGENAVVAEKNPLQRMWYRYVEGLREYRAGNFLDALNLLGQVQPNTEPAAWASANAVAAMAHWHLGNQQEAKSSLQAASEMIQAEWPQPDIRNSFWHDWLIADILRKEAEALIRQSSEH